MKKTLLPLIVATLTVASHVVCPGGALAFPSFSFEPTGSNNLDITAFTVNTYAAGISIAPLGSAVRTGQLYMFPIVGGVVDAETIVLESVSTGGMKILRGSDVVTLEAPVVNTIGSQAIMTFLVTINGNLKGRYEMFNLKVPNYPKPQALVAGETVKAANITVTVSQIGAETLNSALGTTFAYSGLNVGTLKVKTVVSQKLPG